MKRCLLILIIAFNAFAATAQEVSLTDSVIYFDKKPVAYYVKSMNESDPHYNIYIISLNMELLLAAQVVKFEAPVRELKSFYYYDLILHAGKDTLAMYHEGQAFPLELATLIKENNLLTGNTINRAAWEKFKYTFNGNAALKAKIKSYENYLVETRYFDEQTVRDRTKPVTIVNDKIIMQDGKKIGLVVPNVPMANGGISNSYSTVITRDNNVAVQINTNETGSKSLPAGSLQIQLPSNRIIDPSSALIEPKYRKNKDGHKPSLYEISLPLNKTAGTEE